MYTLLALVIFFGGLTFFGWFFSIYLLKEKRLFVLIPLSISLGIFLYLILVNLASYFINIPLSFYLVWIFLVSVGIVLALFYYKRRTSLQIGLSRKYFKYLIIIAIVAGLFGGIGDARVSTGDDIGFDRLALAGSLSGGIFPVKDLGQPQFPGAYHYGAELFAGVLDRIADFPIWFAYAFQAGIFASLIILLVFLLSYKITKNEFVSLITSLVFFFGSGLRYLSIFLKGPVIFYQHYFLNKDIEAPFAFVGQALASDINEPVVTSLSGRWPAIAFALILIIIYFYFLSLEKRKWLIGGLITGLLLGFLALSSEPLFTVLIVVVLGYPFLNLFFGRSPRGENLKPFLISICILLVAILVALYQGGMISTFYKLNFFAKKLAITISSTNLLEGLTRTPVSWSYFFQGAILELGLPLLFFIPALIYFRKNKKILFFIAPLIVISALPPFVFRYVHQWDMNRFFYLAGAFLYFLFALLLANLILKSNKTRKIILFLLVFIIIPGGILNQIFYIIYPADFTPFFKGPPSSDLIDYKAKNWILKNTTPDDYFLAVQDSDLFSDYNPRELHFIENLFFISFYERYSPPLPRSTAVHIEFPQERIDLIRQAREDCSNKVLKDLDIDYIYATPQWPSELEEKCLTNNKLDLVFQSQDNKIYKVLY